jgi:hypothetical protein
LVFSAPLLEGITNNSGAQEVLITLIKDTRYIDMGE